MTHCPDLPDLPTRQPSKLVERDNFAPAPPPATSRRAWEFQSTDILTRSEEHTSELQSPIYLVPSHSLPTRRSSDLSEIATMSTRSLVNLLLVILMTYDPLSGFAGPPDTPAQQTGGARQLRAGAATSNITPRLGISINGYFNEIGRAHV